MKRLLSLAAVVALLSVSGLQPGRADDKALQSVLVDSQWVRQHGSESGVHILELGPSNGKFDAGHIPGAKFVHWVDDMTEPSDQARYTVGSAQQIEALMQRLGVRNQSTIVLYDDLYSRVSARMFWTLKYYGHDDVRILDGGRSAWLKAGFALMPSKGRKPPAQPSDYTIQSTQEQHRVLAAELRRRLTDPATILIDGRPGPQYTGDEPGKVYHTGKAHDQRGHIPGAINILWKDNFNADGTFKSIDELRALYAAHNVLRDSRIITYCNEGLHATPPWFVLTELLGHDHVQVYDESMAEWANNSSFPVRNGDQP